ncbi:hypothetical protein FSP39_016953 [Pinctada imbricata]|uniref:AIG1-type G domain-containing protein n=1 Tax=Pinctada imbricata TaxID=66713 RepID=A0AA88YK25_PINIB|nr:hypothetical protein FSP39_016953 [Pinctada imbricata]
MVNPGPHVVLLVIEIGRYTKEIQNAVDQFLSHLGENVLNHMMVIFTRNDDLKRDEQDISDFISDSDEVLKDMLLRIDNRYIAFDNCFKAKKAIKWNFYSSVSNNL